MLGHAYQKVRQHTTGSREKKKKSRRGKRRVWRCMHTDKTINNSNINNNVTINKAKIKTKYFWETIIERINECRRERNSDNWHYSKRTQNEDNLFRTKTSPTWSCAMEIEKDIEWRRGRRGIRQSHHQFETEMRLREGEEEKSLFEKTKKNQKQKTKFVFVNHIK